MLAARCVQSKFFISARAPKRFAALACSRMLAKTIRHNYVSGIWIPPPIIPSSLPVDWAVRFRQSARGGRKRQCKQTLTRHVPRVMTSLLMSSSPIIISHLLFPRRYSNSRHVAKSASSSSRRVAKAPRRACSHANRLQAHAPWTRVSSQEVFEDLRWIPLFEGDI